MKPTTFLYAFALMRCMNSAVAMPILDPTDGATTLTVPNPTNAVDYVLLSPDGVTEVSTEPPLWNTPLSTSGPFRLEKRKKHSKCASWRWISPLWGTIECIREAVDKKVNKKVNDKLKEEKKKEERERDRVWKPKDLDDD